MKELTQVRDAVMTALDDAGLRTMAAFPAGRAKQSTDPVVTVAVGGAEAQNLGFCDYLGGDGKALGGVIAVDVRAERAADCEKGCEAAAEVLLGGLPSGIRPGELSWEALCWEKETGMFLRRGKLQCRAVFVAQGHEDGEMFLDFILKGVMTG